MRRRTTTRRRRRWRRRRRRRRSRHPKLEALNPNIRLNNQVLKRGLPFGAKLIDEKFKELLGASRLPPDGAHAGAAQGGAGGSGGGGVPAPAVFTPEEYRRFSLHTIEQVVSLLPSCLRALVPCEHTIP